MSDVSPAHPAPAPLPRLPFLLSIVTLLLALAGAAIALMLVKEHLEVMGGGISQGLFCGAAAGRYDCSQVAAHPSSTIAGLPVAAWGLLFYVAMIALALGGLILRDAARAAALDLGAGLATLAVVIDAGLAYVMVTQIGAICLNCVATYVVNVLLAIVFWTLARREKANRSWGALLSPSPLAFKLILLGDVVAGWGTAIALTAPEAMKLREFAALEVEEFREQVAQPPEIDMAAFAGQPSRGPDSARLTIVQTGDFECTYCRAMAVALEHLRRRHPQDIRLAFVNSPVHSDCNPGIKRPVHEEACALGELAEAATMLGKFWEYHDYVFTQIPGAAVTAENAVAHLKDMGIDPEAAHRVLVSGEPKAALERDVELSNRFKLINTPSLVMNGYPKRGGVYPGALGPIVEIMLEKSAAR